jgi:hypothetical protein
MISFQTYLAEANAVGSKFEKKTARMIGDWIKAKGLKRVFDVKRFQTVNESARAEDYSDIEVVNVKTGDSFFVECKEADRSNVLNLQFDIREDGTLAPVKSRGRKELDEEDSEAAAPFVKAVQGNGEFKRFVRFLNAGNKRLGGAAPREFYFGKRDDADDYLGRLITDYNRLVKSGKTEADCKPFDKANVRPSTKNMLACALAWRLSDPETTTWDIFHQNDVPGLGDMIRRHYSAGKKVPARYIQLSDKLFKTGEEDPLGLDDVPRFPDVKGKFALKFTPRFGTGAVYVTPRSEVTTKLSSDYSFNDRGKWPETSLGGKSK